MRVLHLVRDKEGILGGYLGTIQADDSCSLDKDVSRANSDAEDSDLLNLHYNISSMCSPRAPHKLCSRGALAPCSLQRWGSAAGHLLVLSLAVWYRGHEPVACGDLKHAGVRCSASVSLCMAGLFDSLVWERECWGEVKRW